MPQNEEGRAILALPLRHNFRSSQDPVPRSIGDLVIETGDLWTMIAAVAIAVNPAAEYVRVKDLRFERVLVTTDAGMSILMAQDTASVATKEDVWLRPRSTRFVVLERFNGDRLCGMKYQTPFRFYETCIETPKAFTIVADTNLSVASSVGAKLVTPAFCATSLDLCNLHSILAPDLAAPCPFNGTRIHKDVPTLDDSLVGSTPEAAERKVVTRLRDARLLLHYAPPSTWPEWKLLAAGSFRKAPPPATPAKAGLNVVRKFRLMRDVAECFRDPVDGIQLTVQDKDFRQMCAVLTPKDKAYAGIRLHLSISIPMNYPTDSPKVSIDTPIEHPNIFGSYVCCDILKGRLVQDPKTGEIGGYTPAYPLQTVLVQLLSFFTAEKVDQEHTDKSVKRKMQTFAQLKECVSRFSCKHCGFAPPPEVPACEKCGTRPQLPKNREGPVVSCRECGSEVKLKPPPKIPAWYPVTAAGSSSARGKAGKKAAAAAAAATAEKKPVLARCAPRTRPNALDRIIPDVWYMIFARISAKDISAVTAAYPRLKQMINVDSIVIRRNLSCFYLRSGHDDSILGVGVQITAVTKRKVKYSSAFDILSYFAFRESKIRESPWGETFTHFLPLVINYRHFKRARPDIEATLMALNARDEPFDPAVIIPTFARWMNQMVVDLMKDVLLNADVRNAEPRYGKPLLHASEKALTGYCTLMHLLLVMVGTYPQVLQPTYDKVRAFLSDPQARQKSHVPDLGELLIWLILVPGLSWSVVQRPLIEELLTRNVVWVLNQHPHLAHIEHRDCVSERRLQETFKGGLTGLRLLLFQVRFLKDLVWAATDSSTKTTAPAAAAGSGRPIVRVPPPAVVVPPSPARGPDPAVADADDVLFVDRISAASPSKGLSPSRPVSPVSAEQQDEQDDWVVVNRKPQRKPLPALRGGRQSNDRQANATAPNQRPGPSSATVRPSQPTPTPAPSPSPTSPPPTVLPPFDDARSIAHIAALIKTSDATFGFPAPDLAANLAAYARSVLRVADFQAFYSLLEASPDPPRSTPPPPPPASGPSGADSNPATPPPSQPPPPQPTQLSICRALRAAVNRSRAAKYHRTPYTVGELWSLRAAVEPHAAGPTPPSGSQLPQVLPGKRSFFPVPPRRPGVGDGGDGEAGGRRPARRGPPLRRRRQVVHAFKEMSPDCGCSTCVFLRRYQKEVGALTLGDEGEEDYDEYEDGESYFDEDD